MKKLAIIILISISPISVISQTFQKTYGGVNDEFGVSIQQTSDSGFIITGQTGIVGSFNNDILLIRTDRNGDTLWTRTFGNSGDDAASCVQQTSDGGFVIVGYLDGQNTAELVLLRIDSYGNLIWSKSFGGNVYAYGSYVRQTFDGGFIVLGSTNSFGAGMYDVYLIKTDSSGDTLWTKTYGGTDEGGSCVQQTSDSGFIISGTTSSFGAGNEDGFLIKTNPQGDITWSKTYGGVGNDVASSVTHTNDGGFAFAGETSDFGVGSYNMFVVKTDALGNIVWRKTFGNAGFDSANKIRQTIDGGFVFTGLFNPYGTQYWDAYIIRTYSTGTLVWSKTYGGADTEGAYDVQPTKDGGYAIVGVTKDFGSGGNDVYLIRTDSLGESGCNETNYTTLTTTPSVQIGNPVFIVSSGGIIHTPSLLSGSGFNVSSLCSTIGINEINPDTAFLIYPNPAHNELNIQNNASMPVQFILYNFLGEKLIDKILANKTTTIDLSGYASDIYFYRLSIDKQLSKCGTIIKH